MSKKTTTEGPTNPFCLSGTSPPAKTSENQSKTLNPSSVKHTDSKSNEIFENQIEQLLTISELASRLQCSKSYIKKLRANGVITPAISMARFVRYKLSDVLVALQRRSLI